MKKLTAILLMLTLSVGLAACGSGSAETADNISTESQSADGSQSQSADTTVVTAESAEKAVYPLPVEKPGRYRLMGRINYCWCAKDDSEKAIAVVTDKRRISLKWNQAVNSGEWNEIGVLDLAPGSTLEIDVKASRGTVVADAFAVVE